MDTEIPQDITADFLPLAVDSPRECRRQPYDLACLWLAGYPDSGDPRGILAVQPLVAVCGRIGGQVV